MNKTTSLIAAGAFVVALFGSLVLGQVAGTTDHYIVTLSMLPALMILLTIAALGDQDTFSPLYLVLYLLLLSVFAKSVFLIYLDSGRSRLVSLDGRNLEILLRGLLGISVGFAAFIGGYAIVVKRATLQRLRWSPAMVRDNHRAGAHYNDGGFRLFLLFVCTLFVICFALFAREMNLVADLMRGIYSAKRVHEESVGASFRGSSLGYLRWGAVTLPQVVVLSVVAVRLAAGVPFVKPTKYLLVVMGAGSMLIPVLTSARLEMIYLFLMLAMVTHYYRRKFKTSRILLLAVLLVSITGVLGEARTSQRLGVGADTWSVSNVVDKILGSAYFIDVAKTSVVLDSVPYPVDYLYGRSFALFIVAPVPRTLWPEKPVVRISRFVGDEIYNRPDNSGIPPGFIAESYLNFGFPGIVACLLLLGAVCGAFYKRTIGSPRSVLSGLWYTIGIVILTFTLLAGDLTVAISQAVRYGLVLFIVQKVLLKGEDLRVRPPVRRRSGPRPRPGLSKARR